MFVYYEDIHAQPGTREIIQFSGVVITDSLQPIPLVHIIIRNTYRGTISDFYGFFSIVAQKKDTIEFSCVGFKKERFVIPDSLTTNRYSLIQILRQDTFMLMETFIYPWPTKEQFREAFLNTRIPDDDLARAEKNIERAEMKERMENLAMDGSMNYKNYIQNQTSRLYYAGQYPPNNLLNPFAWIKFIEMWRNGEFRKNKDK
ncbi:MAG: carboxypeptidase-like regulatory domain-containing protein [Bacteroidetes bacterium]|nr:carboxypeptidase-like regulatory domain-containing protein [Bacteroidota bacterium]